MNTGTHTTVTKGDPDTMYVLSVAEDSALRVFGGRYSATGEKLTCLEHKLSKKA